MRTENNLTHGNQKVSDSSDGKLGRAPLLFQTPQKDVDVQY